MFYPFRSIYCLDEDVDFSFISRFVVKKSFNHDVFWTVNQSYCSFIIELPWYIKTIIIQYDGIRQFYRFLSAQWHMLVSSSVCGVLGAARLRPRRLLPGHGRPSAGPRAEPARLLHMRPDGVWGGLHSTRTGEMLETQASFSQMCCRWVPRSHTQRNMFRWDLRDGSSDVSPFFSSDLNLKWL